MVVVDIIGGLGNQMFQYAMGRAVSKKLNRKLYLKISGYEKYRLHNGFELDKIFNIKAYVCSKELISNFFPFFINYKFGNFLKKMTVGPFYRNIIFEGKMSYTPINFVENEDVYLSGYWQSEKYFSEIKNEILSDFKFKKNVSDSLDSGVRELVELRNSVSIHVRRGDYALNPKTLSIHGLCDLKYYIRAIKEIEKIVSNPLFVIFSDDMHWSKVNIAPLVCDSIIYEGGSGDSLLLMSCCKHNIIANSTFSWWGAWLNLNPGKIVIAPQKWFSDSSRNSSDLVPSDWMRI